MMMHCGSTMMTPLWPQLLLLLAPMVAWMAPLTSRVAYLITIHSLVYNWTTFIWF